LPVPEETTEIPIDVIQNHSDLSTDSDSDNDLQTSSSDPYENSGNDGLSLDSLAERETNDSQEKNHFLPRICVYSYSGPNFTIMYHNMRLREISLI